LFLITSIEIHEDLVLVFESNVIALFDLMTKLEGIGEVIYEKEVVVFPGILKAN
jgi:hypothetical protein